MFEDKILRQVLELLVPQDWNEHPTRMMCPKPTAKEVIWCRQKKQMLRLRLVCKQWDSIVSDLVVTKLSFDTFCRSTAPANALLWILASMAKSDMSPPSSWLLPHARGAIQSISASSTKQPDDRLWRAPFAAQIAYHGCRDALSQLRGPIRRRKTSPDAPTSASYLPVMIFYGAEDLEEQIDKHGHVNVVDEFFGSALYAAVYTGKDRVTAKLLELGADPNATGGVFHSVLQLASSRGSTSTMHLLLQAGANVNEIGGLYGTPTAAAVIFNHKPALELLLAHGANPNLQSQSAGSLAAPLLAPLIRAAQCGNVEMVHRLLQVEDLDVNIQSEHINPATPLLVALENGRETIAQRLASDSRLDTQAALVDAVSCGCFSIVRFLIEERRVPPDETALLYALEANAFPRRPTDERRRSADDTVTYLLDKFPNFDPNRPSGFTLSAFDHAAENGLENAVRIMLQKGVDLSKNAEGKCMSLALATRNGHAAVVKLLLEHGADPTASPGGWSPLLEAAGGGHAGVIRVLLEQPGIDVNYRDRRSMTPVLCAAFDGRYEALRVLLESGGEVNAQNEYGVSALSFATLCGYTDVVRLLLSYGAQVDIESSPRLIGTLRQAVGREDVATAEALISGGADVNLTESGGWTPLYTAVRNRHEEMVRMLLQREDIELDPRTSEDGRTPLEVAMEEDYPELVTLLLERGAGQPKRPVVGDIHLGGVRARI